MGILADLLLPADDRACCSGSICKAPVSASHLRSYYSRPHHSAWLGEVTKCLRRGDGRNDGEGWIGMRRKLQDEAILTVQRQGAGDGARGPRAGSSRWGSEAHGPAWQPQRTTRAACARGPSPMTTVRTRWSQTGCLALIQDVRDPVGLTSIGRACTLRSACTTA